MDELVNDWHIIGGGPSLIGMVLDDIPRPRTIVVNDAWELIPDAAVLFFSDWSWYSKNTQTVRDFKGEVWSTSAAPYIDRKVKQKHRTQTLPLPTQSDELSGKDSGYRAAVLAYTEYKATSLTLWGFDMEFPGGKSHWHSKNRGIVNEDLYKFEFAPTYRRLFEGLRERGVEMFLGTASRPLGYIPRRRLGSKKELLHAGRVECQSTKS